MTKRKGAKSTKDIPKEILEQLNRGEIETANLVEWLAVDQRMLLENLLIRHGREKYLKPLLEQINRLKKQTVNTVNEAIGTGLLEQVNIHKDSDFLQTVSSHPADLARCWATYTVGKDETLSLEQMFQKIQPFAADSHFGVREIAWMAVRKRIAQNLNESISILARWTADSDENIRRFASEATRPRGVWCEHVEALKQSPEQGLPILEPLKSDKAKYVRDSVGNWLNDAAKTRPDFVKNLCKRWEHESNTPETKYIIKKALRTVEK
ncbi:MAG: DNA alkylation repair protein [Tannerella sp.]|jgi:3-methyladenine DNA glycosylase AlkC|nr:DNA alkylation repair protein [Tannerella sp.]